MQTFRTDLTIEQSSFSIQHQNGTLCIGSCFAEHMGQRLIDTKFKTLLNPFGILYNPISIQQTIDYLLSGYFFTENDLFFHQERWHSFYHHGSFSKLDQEKTLQGINEAMEEGRAFLKKCDRLIITLGTANVFVYKKTGEVVANCHKLPNQDFERKRLSINEIVQQLTSVFKQLKNENPELEIITTVSPIRHIRDGLVENQRSKATLLLSLDELCKTLDFVHYFPSYELVVDDLRDYRFYEADMIHPNRTAIDFIWKAFDNTFFDPKTKELNQKIEKIILASKHRPFNKGSEAHQMFVKQQLAKIKLLEDSYTFLSFGKEKKRFEEQLE